MESSTLRYKRSNKNPFPHNTLKTLLDIICQFTKILHDEDKSDLEERVKILEAFIIPNVRCLSKDELQTVDKDHMMSSIRSLSVVLLGIKSPDCVDMQKELRAVLDTINALDESFSFRNKAKV
ncbi:hypothetical protein HA402_015224 [Bradysia odoriphaga]|nr:hypothetical protein HA402_015224 [Bradysia odoriphaga]